MSKNTVPSIGAHIRTAEQFNRLPLGATLRDRDGWIHTKIAEFVDPGERGGEAIATTTYVDGSTTGPFFYCWNYGTVLVGLPSEVESVPNRPVAALPYDTQRGYAKKARSPKCLDKAHNAILWNASQGKPVDVFAFRQAATAALSLAATRAGQSMARRDWTREARALIHWADAILENHIDGLPAYAEGDRSRAVEDAKAALKAAKDEVDLLIEHRSNQDARIALLIQEKSQVEVELEDARTAALRAVDYADGLVSIIEARPEASVHAYAMSLLSDEQRAQVTGYADAVKGL